MPQHNIGDTYSGENAGSVDNNWQISPIVSDIEFAESICQDIQTKCNLAENNREAYLSNWLLYSCAETTVKAGDMLIDKYWEEGPDEFDSVFYSVIACYENALDFFKLDRFPDGWASIQHRLGVAYKLKITGCASENYEAAIRHYKAALTVRTPERSADHWAETHSSLGALYESKLTGDMTENLRMSVHHFSEALKVCTRENLPNKWARANGFLGSLLSKRKSGSELFNPVKAVSYSEAALEVYTLEDFPEEWAETRADIGDTYLEMGLRNVSKHFDTAIVYYESALTVRFSFASDEFACIQNNMGKAYMKKSTGNPAANLEKAIVCFKTALIMLNQDNCPNEIENVKSSLRDAESKQMSQSGPSCALLVVS